jgi:hypothetical protein
MSLFVSLFPLFPPLFVTIMARLGPPDAHAARQGRDAGDRGGERDDVG